MPVGFSFGMSAPPPSASQAAALAAAAVTAQVKARQAQQAAAAAAAAASAPTSQHVASFGPTLSGIDFAGLGRINATLRAGGVQGLGHVPTAAPQAPLPWWLGGGPVPIPGQTTVPPTAVAVASDPNAPGAAQLVAGAASGDPNASQTILDVVAGARAANAADDVRYLAAALTAAQKLQTQAQYVSRWFGDAEAQKILRGFHMSIDHAMGG